MVRSLAKGIGKQRGAIVDLVSVFLKTPIVYKRGNSYTNTVRGIPQGSPLSPILMNCFLHHLDLELERIMVRNGTKAFYYERYADDMLFGIPSGKEAATITNHTLNHTLGRLKLACTHQQILREMSSNNSTSGKIQVLGLLLTLRKTGG